MWRKPRPEGWDYYKPDAEWLRCRMCNADGMNRTGLKIVGYHEAPTTLAHGVKCPKGCSNGLKEALQ